MQCIELGQSEDGNDDYGVWVDPEEPDLKPYYTILEFNDDGAIVPIRNSQMRQYNLHLMLVWKMKMEK